MIVVTLVDPDAHRHRFIEGCLDRFLEGCEAGFPVRYHFVTDPADVSKGWRMYEEAAEIYREPLAVFLLVAEDLDLDLEAGTYLLHAQRQLGSTLDQSVILAPSVTHPVVIVDGSAVPVLDLKYPEDRYDLSDRLRDFVARANARHVATTSFPV